MGKQKAKQKAEQNAEVKAEVKKKAQSEKIKCSYCQDPFRYFSSRNSYLNHCKREYKKERLVAESQGQDLRSMEGSDKVLSILKHAAWPSYRWGGSLNRLNKYCADDESGKLRVPGLPQNAGTRRGVGRPVKIRVSTGCIKPKKIACIQPKKISELISTAAGYVKRSPVLPAHTEMGFDISNSSAAASEID